MKLLVTGAAGFIGAALSKELLRNGHEVVGLDNINNYYTVELKWLRLRELGVEKRIELGEQIVGEAGFRFVREELSNNAAVQQLFQQEKFDAVVHLAAQAGVRYSLEAPHAYISSNITGFLNILEGCRSNPVEHLVYASSSSVYGANPKQPFSVEDSVDHPVSLYAATKKSNELMAHTYSHLFAIPTTGLRFFTVYGPWGRPDMAPILFANAINSGKPIRLFNRGKMQRDFTYIDDIVEGIVRTIPLPPQPQPLEQWSGGAGDSWAPYRVLNIGRGETTDLSRFIQQLEIELGKKAIQQLEPMQPGDVPITWADTSSLEKLTRFTPRISIEEGVHRFVDWYKSSPLFQHGSE